MKTLLLIDANALIHRAFHALPPMSGKDGRATNAVYGLASILLKIWREERPDFAAALFDRPEPTFRKQEYAEYKAHRVKAVDELISQIIESHNLFNAFHIKTYEAPGFEADDLIGTLAARFRKGLELKIIILTGDLDALQLVEGEKVVVKTLKTGVSKTFIYNEKEVIERYGLPPKKLIDYKAMVGDPSDNIPGISGVGPKTAATLLQKYASLEGIYENLNKEIKIKEKFENQKEDVFFYRRLSAIRDDAPVAIDNIQDLKTEDIPAAALEYFENLGFESLKKRLLEDGDVDVKETIKIKKQGGLGLFAEELPVVNYGSLTSIEDLVFLFDGKDALRKSNELKTSKTKVGFDLKAILKELRANKLEMEEPYFDLGIGFWLLDPDFKKNDPISLFQKFFKREWIGSMADFKTAYSFLKKEIDQKGLTKVFYKIEMPLIKVLASLEEAGILVDESKLKKLLIDINTEISRLQNAIYEVAGSKINLNSPKQLSSLIFDKLNIGLPKTKKTATGLKSTNEEVLKELKGVHPVIDYILQYREIFKLKSTYIEPTLNLIAEDGRLHTTYIQTGAATGRLSSQNPNLQNVPVGNKLAYQFRSAFVAPPGFSLVAFDYSQIELRILASLSEDPKMTAAFKKGEDIHAATAATVFATSISKITPEMRKIAKTLNFGIVYGMGSTAFARNAGLKRDEAKKFIENYFSEFKKIKEWQEKIKSEARSAGFVKNQNGRLRNVPALKFGMSRAASEAERVTINMPIQSLGADIIKLSMIAVQKEMSEKFGDKVRMLLSIHDELLFEIHDAIIKEAESLIKERMESIFALSVPFVVNVSTGKNWAELK